MKKRAAATAKSVAARMTKVCETCYRDADPFERPLMVMVQDSDCEFCKEELGF
jgi:hypothetical protein